jgi:hypothetical protein
MQEGAWVVHERQEKCTHNFGCKLKRKRPKCKWEHNIELFINEKKGVIEVAQGWVQWWAVVNKVMKLAKEYNRIIKCAVVVLSGYLYGLRHIHSMFTLSASRRWKA